MTNKKHSTLEPTQENEKLKEKRGLARIFAVIASAIASKKEIKRLNTEYQKPDTYKRDIYDDGNAHYKAKQKASKSGNFKDPYTKDDLVMTNKEAVLKFGKNNSTYHKAEADHIDSINDIYERAKDNPWIKNEDINKTANRPDNIQVINEHNNKAKGKKSNEEYFSKAKITDANGNEISEQARQEGIDRGIKARKDSNNILKKTSIKNVATEALKSGAEGALYGASVATVVSSVQNIIAVIKGEKEVKDALKDVAKDGASGATTGFLVTASISVIQHTLESSSNKFLSALAESNAPEIVITTVAMTYDIVISWFKGEITTEECLTELGKRGLNAGFAILGNSIIPVPVLGTAVGSLVGLHLDKYVYDLLLEELKKMRSLSTEWVSAQKEAIRLRKESKAFRKEYLSNIEKYFPTFKYVLEASVKNIIYLPLPQA